MCSNFKQVATIAHRSFHVASAYTPSNPLFLGITRVFTPNGIAIGSSIFAGLTAEPNTDKQTTLRHDVCSNSPHLAPLTVIAMRAKIWGVNVLGWW